MLNKKQSRVKRSMRLRAHLKDLSVYRLTVYRSLKHIRAQIIAPEKGKVIAAASTLEKIVKDQHASTGTKEAAKQVGQLLAQRALEKGVNSVGFDRSGFKYHGRVEALATGAREIGLKF